MTYAIQLAFISKNSCDKIHQDVNIYFQSICAFDEHNQLHTIDIHLRASTMGMDNSHCLLLALTLGAKFWHPLSNGNATQKINKSSSSLLSQTHHE